MTPSPRLVLILLLGLLCGCRFDTPAPLDQQLYIWQRQWRPAHAEALAQSRADFSSLRVLALQAHPRAGWSRARIDTELLRADGRPLIAVVRLDGQLPQLDLNKARDEIRLLLNDWRTAGLRPLGLEIDHDCASARLPSYTEFLSQLRRELPSELSLSITALPAWLDSPSLPTLLAAVDSSVLQVHAVSDPAQGLFDPLKALDWSRRWSERSTKPFYLALPAYGIGLLPGTSDRPLVESEAPLAIGGIRRELMADPLQLAELSQTLRADPPQHLAGLIWFRLPLTGDRRAWPLSTLQAVARGDTLQADIQFQVHNQGELYEFHLANLGNLDGPLPQRLELPTENCEAADALAGYRLQRTAESLVLLRQTTDQLAAGSRKALGWARCQTLNQGGLRVQP